MPRPFRFRGRFALCCALAAGLFGALQVFGAGEASAQATPGALDAIVRAFDRVRSFEGALFNIAATLFASLAAIEVVFTIGRHVRAGSDLGDILGALLERAVVIGFFWFILINNGAIFRAIVDSFAMAANDASVAAGGSRNMSPTDTLNVGINIADIIWQGLTIYSPVQSFLLTLGGFFVLLSFGFLCGLVIEVIVEAQIIAAASVLLMGFGGSYWTRDIAISTMRAAIAIGAKRLFLQVMIGLTEVIMLDIATGVRNGQVLDRTTLAVLVAVPFVLAYVCRTLPQRAQTILNGAYIGGPGLSSAAAGAMQGATAAAVAMTGAGTAATAAYRAASAQMEARDSAASGGGQGGGGSSGMGGGPIPAMARGAQTMGLAAKNFGGALAQDVGNRLASSNKGYAGFRAARSLNASAAQTRAATAASSGSK